MKRCVLTVLAAVLLVLPALADECPLTKPTPLPTATVSGTWTGSVLSLVDTWNDQILRYSQGRFIGSLNLSPTQGLQPYAPLAMLAHDGRSLLQLKGGRFVTIGAGMRPVRMQHLFAVDESHQENDLIRSAFSWDVAGNDLVICGDVKRRNAWDSGFLRAPLDDPSAIRFLGERRGIWDSDLIYCRIGYDYIATIGDDAYILANDNEGVTRITRYGVDGIPHPLSIEVGQRPKLGDFSDDASYAQVMAEVEHSTSPAGLFASENALFLLSRRPTDSRQTAWSLTKIDPATGKELGTASLPIHASHLTVVPGSKTWAFVEKDRVRGLEMQDTLGIRYISAEAIEAIGSRDGAMVCDG